MNSFFPFWSPLDPWESLICSLSLSLPILNIWYMWGCTVFVLLCLTSFTLIMFLRFTHGVKVYLITSIPFIPETFYCVLLGGWILYCLYAENIMCLSIFHWCVHLGCFYFLVVTSSASLDICNVLIWAPVSIFKIYP